MLDTKPSQQVLDFLKFQEIGAKFNVLMNDIASIIQNEGSEPSTAEIVDWARNSGSRLAKLIQETQSHLGRVEARMRSGEYIGKRTILGYTRKGDPIYPSPPGMLTTQAFILCCKCNRAIKSTGGPAYGAFCVSCHEDTK